MHDHTQDATKWEATECVAVSARSRGPQHRGRFRVPVGYGRRRPFRHYVRTLASLEHLHTDHVVLKVQGRSVDSRAMAPALPADFLRGWYDARALLAAEWAPAIVITLLDGPLQYKDILAAAAADSPGLRWGSRHRKLYDSILTRNLQALTRDGLVERHETPGTFPPTVHYCLTDACRELVEAVTPLAEWSARHRDLIERTQSRRTSTRRVRKPARASSK